MFGILSGLLRGRGWIEFFAIGELRTERGRREYTFDGFRSGYIDENRLVFEQGSYKEPAAVAVVSLGQNEVSMKLSTYWLNGCNSAI